VYQGASSGCDPSDMPSSVVEEAGRALEHMVAALQLLDDSKFSPAVGARLDHAIETLRDEIAKSS